MSTEKVVTRFAPSPTGFMHVGGVRTALYAYLLAKKYSGVFILRIEDTDKAREVGGSKEHIMESLEWLGIEWDEGPKTGGPHGPYVQSERLDIYKKYADELVSKGFAYPDPYSKEELDTFRKQAEEKNEPFLYRKHRPNKYDVWDGKQTLRFKVPEIKRYYWHDEVYGDLSAGEEALDDFILMKNDGYPTYNFAHIVDDIEMEVTHVLRGQEFISSVPKFLSLYEALEKEPPIFVTNPPIMGPDGKKKLSKRDGAKDVLDYKSEGYLPDAIINFLAFLGWNPGDEREIFSKEELVEAFSIKGMGHSGAGLNEEKLNWINKEHIRKLDDKILREKIFEWLPKEYQNEKIIPVIKERINKFSDIEQMIHNGELIFFFEAPEYEKEKLIFKEVPLDRIVENIKQSVDALSKIPKDNWDIETIKVSLMNVANGAQSRGEVLHPVRVALSGLDRSPDPFTIAHIIGKDETISRLQKAI